MKKVITLLMCLGMFEGVGLAKEGAKKKEKKKVTHHCEKTVDGKVTDLEGVKDRKACKRKGGTWVKGAHHGHHKNDGHDDHDGHDD